MFKALKELHRDEDGAITVDWVVLTAGAVALALGATAMVMSGTERSSETLATTIADRPVGD